MDISNRKLKLIRITTVPISLKLLIKGQMKYMSCNGFEVLMVSADGPERAQIIKSEKCIHKVIPFTRRITPFHDLKCLFLLIKLFKSERPDLVHTHTPKAGLLGMIAAFIARVPIKLHTVAGMPLITAKGIKKHILKSVEKMTYFFADKILFNSKSLTSFAMEKKLIRADKLTMIGTGSSNGIDLKKYNEHCLLKKKLFEVKSSIDFKDHFKYVLVVGRLVKDKGIENTVDSFIEIIQIHPDTRLILLGPIESVRNEEKLPARIINLIQNTSRIKHIPWSNDVEYFLNLSHLLVHASYREGFPNVLLQAGAMSCPIICSDIPGNIDIVDHYKTGIIFKVGSTEDLIEKIDFALSNLDLVNELAKRLQSKVIKNYDRNIFHQKLLGYYRSLISHKIQNN